MRVSDDEYKTLVRVRLPAKRRKWIADAFAVIMVLGVIGLVVGTFAACEVLVGFVSGR
jgi:hypothetical protein